MKFKKGSEPQCYALARKQKYHYIRHPQPRPAMTDIPAVPTLPQIPSLGELGSVGGGAPREGVVMPLSVSDRVSLVRNNMYENFLQKSTQKLQEEIHHTMKMYTVEKHQLLDQLATLRHDMADLKISESGAHRNGLGNHHGSQRNTNATTQYNDRSKKSSDLSRHHNGNHRYSDIGAGHRLEGETVPRSLPPIKGVDSAQHLLPDSEDDDYLFGSSTELDITEHSDSLNLNEQDLRLSLFPGKKSNRKNKMKKEIPSLRLPQIKEEAPRPDWCSGDNSMTLKHKDYSSLTALPQIKEMKEISETNYDIPIVNDPIRCEISLPAKPTMKKVHFSGSNSIQELTPQTKISLPQIPKKKFQMSKPTKRNQRTSLPPLTTNEGSEQKPEEVLAQGSEGTQKWKSVYVNIHDPEQRTKTLGDILYAVRVRMRENEQRLMYGHHSTEDKKDPTLCDYLLVHKEDRDGIRRTRKKPSHKRNHIPNHTAERLHRRSNAVQLQNYLKKLSRERRMIEHMEGEEYRLTHIVGHQQLQEAAQKSVQ